MLNTAFLFITLHVQVQYDEALLNMYDITITSSQQSKPPTNQWTNLTKPSHGGLEPEILRFQILLLAIETGPCWHVKTALILT